MTDPCARATSRPGGALLLAMLLIAPRVAEAQAYRFDGGGATKVIAREGSALVVDADGPALVGRREFYRPVPPLQLRNRWIVVQDSTFGVVFSQPSGVKPDLDSYVGDLYLRSLVAVTAIEVRALVFNVWGDAAGHLEVTMLMERGPGETWDEHPRWRDLQAPAHEQRTSIVWINRVMFDDESVLEADLAPVASAWKAVTGKEFPGLPENSLKRAMGQ
jgi:hypothetical protein